MPADMPAAMPAGRPAQARALDGKVVLLSGTGRGMGRVAARRFAQAGAIVAGGDIDRGAAAQTLEMIESDGNKGTTAHLDVTDEASVASWVEGCAERFGRVDVLYNNAGAVRFARVEDQPFADWRFTLAAELDSVFLVSRQAWPHLAASRGVILNVGSVAGLSGSMAVGRVAHAASKGGVISVTRQLAAEVGRKGIRVNAISPGMIATEGTGESLLQPGHPMTSIAAHIPLGRVGTADEVVSVALFLASSAAAYVSGANIVVDGGWSAVLSTPLPE
jgi:NAD(P)-dependent dehydrogenase (short-subunit alcohol dehydrogenase family)